MVAIDIHCSTLFLVPASLGHNHLMLIGIFHLLYGLINMIWRIVTWGNYQILAWYHSRNCKLYVHGTDDIVIFTTEPDECILIHNHTVLSLSFVNKDNGFRSWNTSLKLAERILQYTPTEIFVDFKGIYDWFSLNLSIVSTKYFSHSNCWYLSHRHTHVSICSCIMAEGHYRTATPPELTRGNRRNSWSSHINRTLNHLPFPVYFISMYTYINQGLIPLTTVPS